MKLVSDQVEEIFYRKGQPHACDAKCKAAGHRYRHKFSKRVPITVGRDGKARAVFQAKTFTMPGGGREPFLINPPLIIANSPKPRRKKKPMAKTIRMRRNGKGQFVAVRSTNPPKKRHHAKRRSTAVARRRHNPPFWLANPKRKTKHRSNPPKIAGIPLIMPDISDVLYVSAGLAGPPIVKGFALKMMPSLSTMAGGYLLEGIGYAVPAAAAYAIGGRTALRKVLVGEAASIVVRMVQSAMAQISTTAVLPGQPAVGRMRGYLPQSRARNLVRGYTGPSRATLRGTPARSLARSSRFSRY